MASWAAVAKAEPAKAVPDVVTDGTKRTTAVIDANAIISGGGLLTLLRSLDRVVTVPEVLREVRDKQSRSWLAALPFTIETLEPAEESLRAVIKFARATGDLHALSAVDTRLLALARTLEVSYYGGAHLKELPAAPRVRRRGAVDAKALPGWGAAGGDWAEMDRLNEEELETAEAALRGGGGGDNGSRVAAEVQELRLNGDDFTPRGAALPQGAAERFFAAADTQRGGGAGGDGAGGSSGEEEEEEEEDDKGDEERAAGGGSGGAAAAGEGAGEGEGGAEWEVAAKSRNKARQARRRHFRWEERRAAAAAAAEGAAGEEELRDEEQAQQQPGHEPLRSADVDEEDESEDESGDEPEDESGDEDGGSVAAADAGVSIAPAPHDPLGFESAVCSVTADFAMQNVLLQMGLRLSAPDGRRIHSVSRWVLRCTACCAITKEVGRLFCPRCGNAALERVRVVVGPDGAEQYGVRKKHVLRGTRFSLPRPRGGRAADVIVAEDQLLAKSHLLRAKKKAAEGEALDPFAPEYSADTWHQSAALHAGAKSAAALLAGWKRNPNERKHVATNRRRK